MLQVLVDLYEMLEGKAHATVPLTFKRVVQPDEETATTSSGKLLNNAAEDIHRGGEGLLVVRVNDDMIVAKGRSGHWRSGRGFSAASSNLPITNGIVVQYAKSPWYNGPAYSYDQISPKPLPVQAGALRRESVDRTVGEDDREHTFCSIPLPLLQTTNSFSTMQKYST